jgi:hypothetical protein
MAEAPPCRFHPGRDISPTLLRVIARDIAMDVREFIGRR